MISWKAEALRGQAEELERMAFELRQRADRLDRDLRQVNDRFLEAVGEPSPAAIEVSKLMGAIFKGAEGDAELAEELLMVHKAMHLSQSLDRAPEAVADIIEIEMARGDLIDRLLPEREGE
jgi:hypothetical protein